jgi:hypothetical protein
MSEETKKLRFLTRSDFDGLACAVLLKESDLIVSTCQVPEEKADEVLAQLVAQMNQDG